VYDAEEVKAAGKVWHKECFQCKECARALNSSNLRDRDGEIYDDSCYGKLFGAKGYGFGGGGGVGLQSGKYEGAEPLMGSAAIDAEIQKKLALKYDEKEEEKVRAWLESFLGEKFPEKNLHEALKSGVRLCTAANKIAPNVVKNVNKSNFAAMQRENIAAYIKACTFMSFNKGQMFETADLYDGKNMVQVIENIKALAERAEKRGFGASGLVPSGAPPVISPVSAGGGGGGGGGGGEAAAPQAEAAAPAPAAAASGGGGGEVCPDCGAERSGDFCADCGHRF
jgi:cysteine/glycine-rich protein